MPKTKAQKREEAEARQAEYEARTPNQQMRLIAERPGSSLKELERVVAKIESGGAHITAKKKEAK